MNAKRLAWVAARLAVTCQSVSLPVRSGMPALVGMFLVMTVGCQSTGPRMVYSNRVPQVATPASTSARPMLADSSNAHVPGGEKTAVDYQIARVAGRAPRQGAGKPAPLAGSVEQASLAIPFVPVEVPEDEPIPDLVNPKGNSLPSGKENSTGKSGMVWEKLDGNDQVASPESIDDLWEALNRVGEPVRVQTVGDVALADRAPKPRKVSLERSEDITQAAPGIRGWYSVGEQPVTGARIPDEVITAAVEPNRFPQLDSVKELSLQSPASERDRTAAVVQVGAQQPINAEKPQRARRVVPAAAVIPVAHTNTAMNEATIKQADEGEGIAPITAKIVQRPEAAAAPMAPSTPVADNVKPREVSPVVDTPIVEAPAAPASSAKEAVAGGPALPRPFPDLTAPQEEQAPKLPQQWANSAANDQTPGIANARADENVADKSDEKVDGMWNDVVEIPTESKSHLASKPAPSPPPRIVTSLGEQPLVTAAQQPASEVAKQVPQTPEASPSPPAPSLTDMVLEDGPVFNEVPPVLDDVVAENASAQVTAEKANIDEEVIVLAVPAGAEPYNPNVGVGADGKGLADNVSVRGGVSYSNFETSSGVGGVVFGEASKQLGSKPFFIHGGVAGEYIDGSWPVSFLAGASKLAQMEGDRVVDPWIASAAYSGYYDYDFFDSGNGLYMDQVRLLAGYATSVRTDVGIWGSVGLGTSQTTLVAPDGTLLLNARLGSRAAAYVAHNFGERGSLVIASLGWEESPGNFFMEMDTFIPLGQRVNAFAGAGYSDSGLVDAIVGLEFMLSRGNRVERQQSVRVHRSNSNAYTRSQGTSGSGRTVAHRVSSGGRSALAANEGHSAMPRQMVRRRMKSVARPGALLAAATNSSSDIVQCNYLAGDDQVVIAAGGSSPVAAGSTFGACDPCDPCCDPCSLCGDPCNVCWDACDPCDPCCVTEICSCCCCNPCCCNSSSTSCTICCCNPCCCESASCSGGAEWCECSTDCVADCGLAECNACCDESVCCYYQPEPIRRYRGGWANGNYRGALRVVSPSRMRREDPTLATPLPKPHEEPPIVLPPPTTNPPTDPPPVSGGGEEPVDPIDPVDPVDPGDPIEECIPNTTPIPVVKGRLGEWLETHSESEAP